MLHQAAIYVRTGDAQSVRVPSAEHMRLLVNRAVENRGAGLLEQIRRLVGPPMGETTATAELFESELRRREEGHQ
jgi:hypothetical protein